MGNGLHGNHSILFQCWSSVEYELQNELYRCWPAPAMVVEGIGLHVEDIRVYLALLIIIFWTSWILAHEENYSYVYKILD